jgi:hypothetical protein
VSAGSGTGKPEVKYNRRLVAQVRLRGDPFIPSDLLESSRGSPRGLFESLLGTVGGDAVALTVAGFEVPARAPVRTFSPATFPSSRRS